MNTTDTKTHLTGSSKVYVRKSNTRGKKEIKRVKKLTRNMKLNQWMIKNRIEHEKKNIYIYHTQQQIEKEIHENQSTGLKCPRPPPPPKK